MFRSTGIRMLCAITVAVLAGFVVIRLVSSPEATDVPSQETATSSAVKRPASELVEETLSSLPSHSSVAANLEAPTQSPVVLPANTGSGKRMVFSVSQQRVWWVDESGVEIGTALVSGRENTPQTGSFQVYSKTKNATGLDGSKIDYFVRFTKGPRGWAIGFHNIPVVDGEPVQTEDQLGQALSHGCIRQKEQDAVFNWNFLEVGSTVVVIV